jgi:hypothetical protein
MLKATMHHLHETKQANIWVIHGEFGLVVSAATKVEKVYIEARYSEYDEITEEEVEWMVEREGVLKGITEKRCKAKIQND